MIAPANHSLTFLRLRPILWLRAIVGTFLPCCSLFCGAVKGQIIALTGDDTNSPSSIHGTVLNRATHEPISRALVYAPGNQYGTLTDDRGHFEFKFPPQEREPEENLPGTPDAMPGGLRLGAQRNFRPTVFFARKPGFLPNENDAMNIRLAPDQSELTLYLVPESLIVGHVTLPGAEGDVRIRLELYRHDTEGGQEHWVQAGSFTSWADGEFRFCDLTAGTYKLVTTEQLDRDPLNFNFAPGEPLFGYPPIFYPASTDFSAAASIQIAAGTTFQATISPTRREYYPVKIPVANAPAAQSMEVRLYPLAHPGPGYSLGYNPAEQKVEGLLPNGNYTVHVDALGQAGWTGVLNFTVSGAALEGPAINLVPNGSLSVNVKEEMQSGQSNFQEVRAETAGAENGVTTQRIINVQVMLFPVEEFSSAQAASAQVQAGPGQGLLIPSVRPGRYRVQVQCGVGYPASVLSGGTDLLHEPLVVGMGSGNSPIEVTIRDDGAEVTGTIEGAAGITDSKPAPSDSSRLYFVYFLPLSGTAQFRQLATAEPSNFLQEELPPGTYYVLAIDRQQQNLEYASEETLRKFESKGQVIQVEAGEKAQLRLKLIVGGEPQ